jgi:hypothetical protein
MVVDSHHRRMFNSDFSDPDILGPNLLWETRGTTYAKGKSDYAKADAQCATIEDGKLVLRVMEGEKDGTFITGHVGTGEVGETPRFSFVHGWAAAKVKFHPLRGALSGFWAQFCTGDYNELDIVEYGGTKRADGDNGAAHHTIWWETAGTLTSRSAETPAKDLNLDFDSKPAVFSCNWTADYYDFWINTRRVARITEGLSSQPKFLVASILVRNYQLDDLLANLGQIKTYSDEYDWIRVWQ